LPAGPGFASDFSKAQLCKICPFSFKGAIAALAKESAASAWHRFAG